GTTRSGNATRRTRSMTTGRVAGPGGGCQPDGVVDPHLSMGCRGLFTWGSPKLRRLRGEREAGHPSRRFRVGEETDAERHHTAPRGRPALTPTGNRPPDAGRPHLQADRGGGGHADVPDPGPDRPLPVDPGLARVQGRGPEVLHHDPV